MSCSLEVCSRCTLKKYILINTCKPRRNHQTPAKKSKKVNHLFIIVALFGTRLSGIYVALQCDVNIYQFVKDLFSGRNQLMHYINVFHYYI